jgi:hypothetical protein
MGRARPFEAHVVDPRVHQMGRFLDDNLILHSMRIPSAIELLTPNTNYYQAMTRLGRYFLFLMTLLDCHDTFLTVIRKPRRLYTRGFFFVLVRVDWILSWKFTRGP